MAHIRTLLKNLFLGLKSGKKRRSRGRNGKIVDEHGLLAPAIGSFGPCYRGRLEDKTEIVVRRLQDVNTKGEAEFCEVVNLLAQIKHKNLLSIRGFCVERAERMLVYNLMPNGSVFAHLHGGRAWENLLTWERRMSIALGAAQGLEHLHHYANPPLVHGGIKASNILLDSSFQASVTEFGLEKLLEDGDAVLTSSCCDYLAPERQNGSPGSSMPADVFSFGLLLLEVVSGKKLRDPLGLGSKQTLLQWAQAVAATEQWEDLADPKLERNFVQEELKKVANVAISCASANVDDRPSMLEVTKLLQA